MTTREELKALAETVQKLTGPDRGVDLEIARHRRVTVWKHDPETSTNYETTHWHYTASLDAAMSLVPDCHRAGVLHHALRSIQETGFPGSTFLQKLICNIVAQALLARAEQMGEGE